MPSEDAVTPLVVLGVVSEVTCHFLAYVFPAYQTFKAVRTDEVEQYTKWVTFWIVNTYFTVFEILGGEALTTQLPYYFPLKVLVLALLLFPPFNGAAAIYAYLLAPAMLRYEDGIDRRVERLQEKGEEAMGRMKKKGGEKLEELSRAGIRQGAGVVKFGLTQVVKEVQQNPSMILRMLEEKEEEGFPGQRQAPPAGSLNRRSTERRQRGEAEEGIGKVNVPVAVGKEAEMKVKQKEKQTEKAKKKEKKKGKEKKEKEKAKKGRKKRKKEVAESKESFDVEERARDASRNYDLTESGYNSLDSDDLEKFLQDELL